MKIDSIEIDQSFLGWLKFLFYIVACSVGIGLDYIGVERVLVYTLTGLMLMDWLTGILKAWKLGVVISSKKSNKGLVEKFALLLIPIAIGITLKVVGIPIGITIKGCFSLLCVAELYSLIGNCYCIYTGEEQKEYDAASAIIKYLRNKILNVVKAMLKK